MKNLILSLFIVLFAPNYLSAQDSKNELGISLMSLQFSNNEFAKIRPYVNPLNSIIYKREIKENLKLRGIVTVEINTSDFSIGHGDSYIHTAYAAGASAGVQYGKILNKIALYGYGDLFFSSTSETLYFDGSPFTRNPSGEYEKIFRRLGTHIGLGLEFNFSDRLSLALEPSLSIFRETSRSSGYFTNFNREYIELDWRGRKETKVSFRGINILSINVKF
jgi:hypothetical protein